MNKRELDKVISDVMDMFTDEEAMDLFTDGKDTPHTISIDLPPSRDTDWKEVPEAYLLELREDGYYEFLSCIEKVSKEQLEHICIKVLNHLRE